MKPKPAPQSNSKPPTTPKIRKLKNKVKVFLMVDLRFIK